MQQQHALLDAVALGGAFEGVDQAPQRGVQPEHGVVAVIFGIAEESITDALLAKLLVGLGAVREDHVVDALEGVAGYARLGADDVEVFLKRPFPVLAAELAEILALGDE